MALEVLCDAVAIGGLEGRYRDDRYDMTIAGKLYIEVIEGCIQIDHLKYVMDLCTL